MEFNWKRVDAIDFRTFSFTVMAKSRKVEFESPQEHSRAREQLQSITTAFMERGMNISKDLIVDSAVILTEVIAPPWVTPEDYLDLKKAISQGGYDRFCCLVGIINARHYFFGDSSNAPGYKPIPMIIGDEILS